LVSLLLVDVVLTWVYWVYGRPTTPLDNFQNLNDISVINQTALLSESSYSWSASRDERAVVSTLYTDSYAPAILTLGHTLASANVSARRILLYIPERISSRTICLATAAGWTLHPVPFIPPPHNGDGILPHFVDQYTKLNIWTLDQLGVKSLVYLDADTLVLKNFDELFALPFNFAATPDVFMDVRGFTIGINAGVLFIRPNTDIYTDMLSKLETADYPHKFAEQAFLNAYFAAQTLRLPYAYNGNMIIKKRNPKLWESLVGDMRIIHYTVKKPFPPTWLEPSDLEAFFDKRRRISGGVWAEEMGWWQDSYREMTQELQGPLSQCT